MSQAKINSSQIDTSSASAGVVPITNGNLIANVEVNFFNKTNTLPIMQVIDVTTYSEIRVYPSAPGANAAYFEVWSDIVTSLRQNVLYFQAIFDGTNRSYGIVGYEQDSSGSSVTPTIPMTFNNGNASVNIGPDRVTLIGQSVVFPQYTLSSLPPAYAGGVIVVTDANGGVGTVCFSKGANWIDIKTGSTVA